MHGLQASDANAKLLKVYRHFSAYCLHKGTFPRHTKILAGAKLTQRWKDAVRYFVKLRLCNVAKALLQRHFLILPQRFQPALAKLSFSTNSQRRYSQSFDVLTTLWQRQRLWVYWVKDFLFSERLCMVAYNLKIFSLNFFNLKISSVLENNLRRPHYNPKRLCIL